MLSRPYRIVLSSVLLFLISIALLSIQFMSAGFAPMWLGRFIESVCSGGAVDWTALECCGLHIWAKSMLFMPSLFLILLSRALAITKRNQVIDFRCILIKLIAIHTKYH